MGGVFHSIEWWWRYFKSLFDISAFSVSGTITLAAGTHEIEVRTKLPHPDCVFLCASEPDNAITTCVGDLNWVAARMTSHGFILFANIKSNTCDIDYIVKYNADVEPTV